MVTCFPSQTSSNLMIVTFAQSFWLGSRVLFIIVRPTVNFSEVIRLNVQIFCTFEVRPEVTNILVTSDNILHLMFLFTHTYTHTKKIEVPFSSTMLRYFVRALPGGSQHLMSPSCRVNLLTRVGWLFCSLTLSDTQNRALKKQTFESTPRYIPANKLVCLE